MLTGAVEPGTWPVLTSRRRDRTASCDGMTANGTLHAFLYTPDSGMLDLGTLGGGTSKGYGINATGRVTGVAVTSGGVLHAFLYSNHVMRDLKFIDRSGHRGTRDAGFAQRNQ